MEIYGRIKLKGNLEDGTGDPLLTRDSSTDSVGIAANALGTLTSAHLFVGDGSNVPTDVAVSGDISIDNTGLTSIVSGVIVDSDINNSASITLSKLAPITASRALASNSSGVISAATTTLSELNFLSGTTSLVQNQINGKQATITGAATTITSSNLGSNLALISNGSGKVSVSTITSTELGRLSGVSGNVQDQLDTKLAPTISSVAAGDILFYNGTAWVNLPRGTNGQALYSNATSVEWNTPTINGIPVGGATSQVLAKQSGTDFDADWETLTVSSITDLTATAAELNILDGATITVSELNYLSGLSSSVQNQLNTKLSSTLPQNAILVGNSSNVASTLAAGTSGYVLTSVSGVPTWQPVSAGTTPGSNTQVLFNDGGTFGADAGMTYDKTNDALTIGGARIHTYGTSDNVFIGNSSGNFTHTLTSGCIGIGTNTLSSITTNADDNIAIGNGALDALTTGQYNTAIGSIALDATTDGMHNVAVGYGVLTASTSDDHNTAIGYGVFSQLNGGSDNIGIGYRAGSSVTTGSGNIIIHVNQSGVAGTISSGSNNILIGYNNSIPSATGSNQLNIQNAIYGTNNSGTGTTVSTGKIGLYVPAPSARLHLPAGTATAAPLKLTTGTALTTPEDGAVEYHSSHLYFTSGSTRYQLDQQGGITNSASLHELMKSDGTNAVGAGITVLSGVATGLAAINGSLKVGTASGNTSAARRIEAEEGSAFSNTMTYPLRVTAWAADAPGVGIGSGMEFASETSSGNYEVGATIEAVVTDVTSGSEDFDLVFKTMAAGAAANEKLRITSDGRLYGTALHNNAGSVTGTTNQYIASGTYTPTCTSVTNCDAAPTASTGATRWIRVGNNVTVSGQIIVDPTTAATLTTFRFSLPIASNFAGGGEGCSGSGSVYETVDGAIDPAHITGDPTNDEAVVIYYPSGVRLGTLRFTLMYTVL